MATSADHETLNPGPRPIESGPGRIPGSGGTSASHETLNPGPIPVDRPPIHGIHAFIEEHLARMDPAQAAEIRMHIAPHIAQIINHMTSPGSMPREMPPGRMPWDIQPTPGQPSGSGAPGGITSRGLPSPIAKLPEMGRMNGPSGATGVIGGPQGGYAPGLPKPGPGGGTVRPGPVPLGPVTAIPPRR